MKQLGNPYDVDDVLVCEFVVLEELDFDLSVYHAYELLERFARESGLDSHETLWHVVNDTYQTAAALRHPPHVIALGCIHVAAEIKERDLSAWFATLTVDHSAVWDVARRVLDLYELINELSPAGSATEKQTTRALLLKLPLEYQPK